MRLIDPRSRILFANSRVLAKQCITPLSNCEDFKVLYRSESDSLLCMIAGISRFLSQI